MRWLVDAARKAVAKNQWLNAFAAENCFERR